MDFVSLPGFSLDDTNGRRFQELLLGSPQKFPVQRNTTLLITTSITFECEVTVCELRLVCRRQRLHTMLSASLSTPDERLSGFTNDGGSLSLKGPLRGSKFAVSIYGSSTVGGKTEMTIDKIIIDYVEGERAGHDLLIAFDDQSNPDNFHFFFPKEDKSLFASKTLLSSRSPVMERMLNNRYEMKESTTRRVDITETSYDVFREFLEFFYTDEVRSNTPNVVELFALADQYQFVRLRMAAFNAARKIVDAGSVLRMAEEAQKFRAADISVMLLSYARTRSCPADVFRQLAILHVTGPHSPCCDPTVKLLDSLAPSFHADSPELPEPSSPDVARGASGSALSPDSVSYSDGSSIAGDSHAQQIDNVTVDRD